MPTAKRLKLFKNGASQAVGLPAEFRFEGNEVYASRNSITGDVLLSNRPGALAWQELFEFLDSIDIPDDFMSNRPMNVPPVEKNLFDEN